MRELSRGSGRAWRHFVLATAVLCCVGEAHAEQGAGAFRLGSGLTLVDVLGFPDTGVDTLVTAGIASPTLALNVGFQPADPVLIGLRTTLAYQSLSTGAGSVGVGAVSLVPFVEVLLARGTFVPFVGAQAGPRISIPSNASAVPIVQAGALFGLHAFVTDTFSVSPELWTSFLYNTSVSRAGWEISLVLNLSGWMFGGNATGEQAASVPPPTEIGDVDGANHPDERKATGHPRRHRTTASRRSWISRHRRR